MKKLFITLFISMFLLSGCGTSSQEYNIIATTLPVYTFTTALCKDTNISVGRLITESVSCLHDYSLQVKQMRMIENADIIVISGVGLEDFLEDTLHNAHNIVDASKDAHTLSVSHSHEHLQDEHAHQHDLDPHIWLSPLNAQIMVQNIYQDLLLHYPEQADVFHNNFQTLLKQLEDLQNYGVSQLSDIGCRELITFHDGFSYFAESFDLTILEAIEEESGSEASAKEIIHLANLIDEHQLPAIFTEISGSDACAGILQVETGAKVYALNMAMSGDSYFDAMYHNIDTIKEALQ